MKYSKPPIEQSLCCAFVIFTGITLATWTALVIIEGMNHQVEWWMAVIPAAIMLGCAFAMDASSTIRFDRRMVAACDSSPLMMVMARRYGVLHGIVAHAVLEACFLAVILLASPDMAAHHLMLGAAALMAVTHCRAWASNNRYWGCC